MRYLCWNPLGRLACLAFLLCCAVSLAGCAAIRAFDFKCPAIRWDKPNNSPLPARTDPAVEDALDQWQSASSGMRQQFPTPYHVFVDTPAPGTFEGPHVIGIGFSGGGTRGTLFNAMCVKLLEELGPIVVETPERPVRINLLNEVAYVSGVSSGAFPAAVFALACGSHCPPGVALDQWPSCFNRDVTGRALRDFARRPHLAARDMIVDINSRPIVAGAIASTFFDGRPAKPGSGLTFAHLPSTPILLIGSLVSNDPGAHFVHTRLAYRYALDFQPQSAWSVTDQTFETFHTNPMTFSLAEACYNSATFPGFMRSGMLAVRRDPDWILERLDSPERDRMRRARNQPGYEGIYDIREGGLVENFGVLALDRVFMHLFETQPCQRTPLILNFDAGYRDLRPPEKGRGLIKKGWGHELYAASRASWHSGQEAFEERFACHARSGAYVHARFRFTAWIACLDPAQADTPETSYFEQLCREEPAIGDADTLLSVTRSIGTTFGRLDDRQVAAIWIAARFAVHDECRTVLAWASELYDGAVARFEHVSVSASSGTES